MSFLFYAPDKTAHDVCIGSSLLVTYAETISELQ